MINWMPVYKHFASVQLMQTEKRLPSRVKKRIVEICREVIEVLGWLGSFNVMS